MDDAAFADDLAAWVGAASVDEAARSRAAEHWARESRAGEATLVGVLVDLAERGGRVGLAVTTGRTHHGRIVTVGVDVVALVTDHGARAVVALAGLTRVTGEDGPSRPIGGRPAPLELTFGAVLAGLAAQRERVRLGVAGDPEPVVGELWTAGLDVVSVRTDAGRPVHLPLGRVADAVIA